MGRIFILLLILLNCISGCNKSSSASGTKSNGEDEANGVGGTSPVGSNENISNESKRELSDEEASQFPRAYTLISDADNCSSNLEGRLVYSKSERQFYTCTSGDWKEINLKGNKGDQGDRGPQGPIGEQGPIGLSGEQGPKGAAGLNSPRLAFIDGNTNEKIGYILPLVLQSNYNIFVNSDFSEAIPTLKPESKEFIFHKWNGNIWYESADCTGDGYLSGHNYNTPWFPSNIDYILPYQLVEDVEYVIPQGTSLYNITPLSKKECSSSPCMDESGLTCSTGSFVAQTGLVKLSEIEKRTAVYTEEFFSNSKTVIDP